MTSYRRSGVWALIRFYLIDLTRFPRFGTPVRARIHLVNLDCDESKKSTLGVSSSRASLADFAQDVVFSS